MQPPFEHPTLTKGKVGDQEKEAIQEKDVAEVGIDLDLTRETETPVPTPIPIPNQKGKEKVKTKKANRDPDPVPMATESRKIHAAIAAVTITLLEPVKRMVRLNQPTSRQTSTLPSTRQP